MVLTILYTQLQLQLFTSSTYALKGFQSVLTTYHASKPARSNKYKSCSAAFWQCVEGRFLAKGLPAES